MGNKTCPDWEVVPARHPGRISQARITVTLGDGDPEISDGVIGHGAGITRWDGLFGSTFPSDS